MEGDGGVLRGTVPQEEGPISASSLMAAPASRRELRVELCLVCECQVFANTCPITEYSRAASVVSIEKSDSFVGLY